MKDICSEHICTGCGLCVTVCSKCAISFRKGKLGHLFPIIDQTKCIDCGLCQKKCPAINTPNLYYPKKAYAAFSKDIEDYKSSTSGGAASVFSNYIIEQGGIVYGCAVCKTNNKTLDVKHIRVSEKEDLLLLKGSKYVQSRITDVLPLIKSDIKNGKKVLFIGTPCQTAAIRNLFPKNPENLYVVDIICHGVPSLAILHTHIKNKIGNEEIDNIRFRDGSELYLQLIQGNKVLYGSYLFKERYKDEYYNAFMDGFTYRLSCHNCSYAGSKRVSDITIGDFWGLGKENDASYIKPHDDGISVILPITDKGVELIEAVSSKLNIYERSVSEAINGNDQLREPKTINKRIRFFKYISCILPFKYAYSLSVLDIKMRKCIVKLLSILGIKNFIKKICKK